MILKKANKEKQKLKDSLSKPLISVKFKGVTKPQSHFLGISIQYWNDKIDLIIKTLALINSEANYTRNIKEICC